MKTKGRGLETYALCREQILLKARRVKGCIHSPHIHQGRQRKGTFASFFQEAVAIRVEIQELREKRLTCLLR